MGSDFSKLDWHLISNAEQSGVLAPFNRLEVNKVSGIQSSLRMHVKTISIRPQSCFRPLRYCMLRGSVRSTAIDGSVGGGEMGCLT
jgi:hypothetical protein